MLSMFDGIVRVIPDKSSLSKAICSAQISRTSTASNPQELRLEYSGGFETQRQLMRGLSATEVETNPGSVVRATFASGAGTSGRNEAVLNLENFFSVGLIWDNGSRHRSLSVGTKDLMCVGRCND